MSLSNFRYPNVAQELLCQSFPMISAIIEGGWIMKTIVTELSEDEEEPNENEPDEEATVISEKPKKRVEMKKPGGLQISLDDDDEGSDELIEDQPTNN